MIKTYLLDFSGAEADDFSASLLPSFIQETKNEILRRERFFSYLLLSYVYCENFGSQMPCIEKDGYGRPYFPGSSIDFNLSHSANLAALVISDEGKVGVDVQKISDNVSAALVEKIKKSFSPIGARESKELVFLSASDGKISVCDDFVVPFDNDASFFIKWTEREALSKADGRGLSYISKVNIENFILISQEFLRVDDSDYVVSVVKQKNQGAEA